MVDFGVNNPRIRLNWEKSDRVFPIDHSKYRPQSFSLIDSELSESQLGQLLTNIGIFRDSVVFMSALGKARGVGAHTGGYDIIPEALIARALIKGNPEVFHKHSYDTAGHRAADKYVGAAADGHISWGDLWGYRMPGMGLPGHPEKRTTPGIESSDGRLGHRWAFANGISLANLKKSIFIHDSDGSQQEGLNYEAARFAVEHGLKQILLIDDNKATISGRPKDYFSKWNLAKVHEAWGLKVFQCNPEDERVDASPMQYHVVARAGVQRLYKVMRDAINASMDGPVSVILDRPMVPGIPGVEGTPQGHDAIALDPALNYLKLRGHNEAAEILNSVSPLKRTAVSFQGSGDKWGSKRSKFGETLADILEMSAEVRENTKILDSDLEGSNGLIHVKKRFPSEQYPGLYIQGGIAEGNNLAAACGFGEDPRKQGVFSTFAAFQEMLISIIRMADLNDYRALIHFSHSGVDDMADNDCHFGINNFFAACGLSDSSIRLYMPADEMQMSSLVRMVFGDPGLRFIYSTRSKVPNILDENGRNFFDSDNGYEFVPGKDELIRDGKDGFVISYGDMLYRSLDAVEQLRGRGIDVGLINKPSLNVVDEGMMKKVGDSGFAVVVEGQSEDNGLGIRYGTWLSERDYHPKFRRMGITKPGISGLWHQVDYQGLSPCHIKDKILRLTGHEDLINV
jgi:transketolase